eukprot:Sro1326_g263020.1 n/a (304) ;mRNA; f:14564-15475
MSFISVTEGWAPEEEDTPRRFKSIDPDVTVVVGGTTEFFHYKSILCTCDFFDKMLSSSMKESETSKIEFPDGDPEAWLEVYKFLDPFNYIALEQPVSSLLTDENVEVLIPWFDYLGMEQHLHLCDQKLHFRIMKSHQPPSHDMWERYKDLPTYPKTKQAIIDVTKFSSHDIIRNATTTKKADFEELKKFLLDDECGEAIWSYFTSTVVNLPQGMLDDLDRKTIIASPMLQHIVGMCPKPIPRAASSWSRSVASNPPAKTQSFLDSSSDEDSSEPPRRRAPAPPPPAAARMRSFFDSDSDSDSS